MEKISRVTRTKTEAKSAYDAMSSWYDWLAGSGERRFREKCLRMLDVQTGERALEIGYGTGESMVALARAVGPAGAVFGIDISKGMRNRTLVRLQKEGLAERADLKLGDAAELPFAPGSMDAVFLAFTLELFDTPEIPVVVGECERVLRLGGRLGLVSMAQPEQSNLMVRLYGWAHRVLPVWIDCRPIRARTFLEGAGFSIVEQSALKMWGLPLDILLAVKRNGV